jgi:uncharacterized membrane protein
VEKELNNLQKDYPHRLIKVNVEEENIATLVDKIPVVEVGPYQLKAPIDPKDLKMTLGAAQDRSDQLDKIQLENQSNRPRRTIKVNFADKLFHWLSNRYMLVFNAFVSIYLGLAILAPVLQQNGNLVPARVIYTVYGRLCHQLTYRSWFLFGEQVAYPREIAGVDGLRTYEEVTGYDPFDLETAYKFLGNDQLGYKIALCQRDIAIYGGILFFGLLFSLTRRKIPSLPVAAWIILGIIPIGLDGISQIVSQLPLEFIPMRESTPLLRSITGALFGFSTAWFGYPIVEETMTDTRKILTVKIKAAQLENS